MNERKYVVDSLLDHLATMPHHPWRVLRLDNTHGPEASGRSDFGQVVIPGLLRRAVERLNPWLEPDQVEQALHLIEQPTGGSLLEINRHVQTLLRDGVPMENRKLRIPGTTRFVSLTDTALNDYLAVEEFTVRIPGTSQHIRPDVTLFVNGLPWVVVEAKAPKAGDEDVSAAIDQLNRYQNQRGFEREGNPALFHYNLCTVATCRTVAKFGTITTRTEAHFYGWSDPFPFELEDLPHGSSTPNAQDRLVRGMLYPPNLLHLLNTFALFVHDEKKGQTYKVVARYQQFRAVIKAIDRLRGQATPRERGGIVWHTQGSGKSLTMVFLIRELYRFPELMAYKVVLLTDRVQLDDQIKETVRATGQHVREPGSIQELKEALRSPNSEVVSALIHKFQEKNYVFPELNASDKILILTDEAHRSQYTLLGSNLEKALPNATRIAFTGTPIEKTTTTFGGYIDKYTMRQAIDDKVTLRIVYEGRTHKAEVADAVGMDERFADVFSDYNIRQRLEILGFGTRDAYLEAQPTINAKGEDMLRHYLSHVFPSGFKAQVVASSKEAAHRYRLAFETALPKILAELEAENSQGLNLEALRKLQVKVVLSSGHNDAPYLKAYGNSVEHKEHIRRFQMPFGREEDGLDGNVGLLIVVEMLLTGFDAPIEQVMYLDRLIRGHHLLQAIARVNRVAGGDKDRGFIVDYVGIGHHLKDALDVYDEMEQAEVLAALDTRADLLVELTTLRDAIRTLFAEQGVHDLDDHDAAYDVLYDETLRLRFVELYRQFMALINDLFPSKEALLFLHDLRQFEETRTLAGQHFRDRRVSMMGVPAKLRTITDAYLRSQGVNQSIEPVSILDEAFAQQVAGHSRTRTKAAAVEHAVRHHIEINFEEDPALYASLAEELKRLLEEFRNNWEEIYRRLQELIRKIKATESEPTYGLHRRRQMPFFREFRKTLFENRELTEEEISSLVALTQEITGRLALEMGLSGFWQNTPAQNKLKATLQGILLAAEFKHLPHIFRERNALISRILEIAKANHGVLTRDD